MTRPELPDAGRHPRMPARPSTPAAGPPRPSARCRLAGFAVALAALAACGPPGGQTADPARAADARIYRVRGILESLPDPATGGELRLRHEAIPDLVGASGEVEGMAAMTMPFPVADGVELGGFAAGDPVRIDLSVDWEAARPVAVTAIEKLPPGTELKLD